MSDEDQATASEPTDQERGQSGSGGRDATDDDRDDMTEVVGGEDVPKPDPDKDQADVDPASRTVDATAAPEDLPASAPPGRAWTGLRLFRCWADARPG